MTRKKVVWTIIAVAAAAVIGWLLFLRAQRLRLVSERLSVPIEGAVLQRDADPQKELPITDVVIAASDGLQVQWLLDPGAVDVGRSLSILERLFPLGAEPGTPA